MKQSPFIWERKTIFFFSNFVWTWTNTQLTHPSMYPSIYACALRSVIQRRAMRTPPRPHHRLTCSYSPSGHRVTCRRCWSSPNSFPTPAAFLNTENIVLEESLRARASQCWGKLYMLALMGKFEFSHLSLVPRHVGFWVRLCVSRNQF